LSVAQKTVREPAQFTGIGVNLGREVTLRILPAPPNTGIIFRRTDLPNAPSIPVSPEYVCPMERRTMLQHGEAQVQMTEHLLAAASGLEIDNLVVEVSGPELPAGDGSARVFTDLLLTAGPLEQDTPRVLRTLAGPVTIAEGSSTITASPSTEGITVSYTLEYTGLAIAAQRFEIHVTPESFAAELASARTFVLQSEAAALLSSGFGRGASLENTLVLRQDGSLVYGDYRFPDELARHKAVDLLGDLRLVGTGIAARIDAVRTGHAHNFRLVQLLASKLIAIPAND